MIALRSLVARAVLCILKEGNVLLLQCQFKFTANFSQKIPVGIVLSSLSWWRGEWIGLTLCINLFALLDEICTSQASFEGKLIETASPLLGKTEKKRFVLSSLLCLTAVISVTYHFDSGTNHAIKMYYSLHSLTADGRELYLYCFRVLLITKYLANRRIREINASRTLRINFQNGTTLTAVISVIYHTAAPTYAVNSKWLTPKRIFH